MQGRCPFGYTADDDGDDEDVEDSGNENEGEAYEGMGHAQSELSEKVRPTWSQTRRRKSLHWKPFLNVGSRRVCRRGWDIWGLQLREGSNVVVLSKPDQERERIPGEEREAAC